MKENLKKNAAPVFKVLKLCCLNLILSPKKESEEVKKGGRRQNLKQGGEPLKGRDGKRGDEDGRKGSGRNNGA